MVHFISFLSTMTARAPDRNLLEKKQFKCLHNFLQLKKKQKKKKTFKANHDWDKIAEPLPQEGKLTNQLISNR